VNSTSKEPSEDKQSTAKELAREFRWVEFISIGVNVVLAIIGIIALCIYYEQLGAAKILLTSK